jgi:DNA-binding MarR family transcriptional regulator
MTERRTDRVEALDLLLLVSGLLEDDMARELPARGLTKARTHALWVLAQQDGCTQRRLADALGIAPRSMSETIDGLVQGGFVVREKHPDDGRAFRISLTDQGRRTTQWLQQGHRDLADELFGEMDPDRYEAFVDTLSAVSERLHRAIEAGATEGSSA